MMTMMAIIKTVVNGQWSMVSAEARRGDVKNCEFQRPKTKDQRLKTNPKSKIQNPKSQSGMSLIAVLAVMTLVAIAMLAVAPTVQQGVQREKELETIRRGEEVAEAIKQYVIFYRGTKLPSSMDDLLEGLPFGTKKRQILRPSAAIDPLSEDGKWRLVKFDSKSFINFGRHVQIYNNGVLPASPGQYFDRYALSLVNIINTQTDSDLKEADDEIEVATDSTPFIGVASQSRSTSVIAYYGIENHSKWIFTPLFRSAGISGTNNRTPTIPTIGRDSNRVKP
jgi:type II secretory pathway pseudopilin PulG